MLPFVDSKKLCDLQGSRNPFPAIELEQIWVALLSVPCFLLIPCWGVQRRWSGEDLSQCSPVLYQDSSLQLPNWTSLFCLWILLTWNISKKKSHVSMTVMTAGELCGVCYLQAVHNSSHSLWIPTFTLTILIGELNACFLNAEGGLYFSLVQ